MEAERLLAAGRADAAMFELRRVIGTGADTPLALRDTLETLVAADVSPDSQRATRGCAVLAGAARHTTCGCVGGRRPRARRRGTSRPGTKRRASGPEPVRRVYADGRGIRPARPHDQGTSSGCVASSTTSGRRRHGDGPAQRSPSGRRRRRASGPDSCNRSTGCRADRRRRARSRRRRRWTVRARQALALIEGSVSLSRKNLDVVRQTYELGQRAVSDVLAEQRRYLDIERTYTDTLRAAFDARTALRRARGELE